MIGHIKIKLLSLQPTSNTDIKNKCIKNNLTNHKIFDSLSQIFQVLNATEENWIIGVKNLILEKQSSSSGVLNPTTWCFILIPWVNKPLHNEAKSPSRVHFWDLCNIYDFKPIFGVFHAWRPQNNTQSDVDHYLLSLP